MAAGDRDNLVTGARGEYECPAEQPARAGHQELHVGRAAAMAPSVPCGPSRRRPVATDSRDRVAEMLEPPPAAAATPQVKLVVWDLDETLWTGTLTEGPVELSDDRADLLRRLVDQ